MIKFYTNLITRHYRCMLLAFLSLFFLSGSLFAQVATKYIFSSSTNNAYNEITGGTVLNVTNGPTGGSIDDDDYFNVPFGFSFFYNGISYTSGYVSCNGYIKLGTNLPLSTYSFGPAVWYEPNAIVAFSTDLSGKGATTSTSNLRIETQGFAPYRIFVIQFKDWTVYNPNAAIMAGETYNFQIRLHENDGNGYPEVCYGRMISQSPSTCQVGISGSNWVANPLYPAQGQPQNTITDFNVRAGNFMTSTASTTNNSYNISYSSTNIPDSGLKYKWAIPPQKMVIDSVSTISVSGGLAPGSTDNPIIAAVVYTKGDSAKEFITEVNFNTTGTTSLADVTAVRVYFSGTNSVFSPATATQYGATINNPTAGTLSFTGLDSLSPGANYFWLTYDVSFSATVGDVLDGQCVNVVDSFLYTKIPLVSSPAGSRQIVQPMSGTYTINAAGSGPNNFASFNLAFDAMNINGLSGPVTFIIAANTYTFTSPLIINSVPGLSSTNTITFEGANKTTTILTGNLPSSQVVRISSKYITLRNLTITNSASGSCSGITILGTSSSGVGTGSTINNCIINLANATTSGAAIGMTVDATGNSFTTSVLMDSVTIDSNVINGGNNAIAIYGALNISYNKGIKIRNNKISNTKTNAMFFQYNMNTIEILENELTLSAGTGINMLGCEGSNTSHLIRGNKISGFTIYGIQVAPNQGALSFPLRIYNNLIVSANSGSQNCVNINLPTPSPIEIYHNTLIYNVSTTTAAYGPIQTSGTTGLTIKNNLFVNNATGGTNSAAYIGTNPAASSINYNVYYNRNSANPNMIYRSGVQYTTSNFQTVTSGGDSSYNSEPAFNAQNVLTNGCSPKSALDLTSILPLDVNGVTRAIPSYIGAHESSILANDMRIEKLISPVAPIQAGFADVIVRVKNNGSNPVYSFSLNYQHNSDPVVTQSAFQTILSCDTATITFVQQVSLIGANQLKVYTSLPNSVADDDMTNDTVKVGLFGALAGTYTVGGSNPDFPTVIDAVSALQAGGVTAPVTFNIAPGTYTGQVVLNGPINGISDLNPVTFEGNDAGTRTITASVGAGAFQLNGLNYIKIRNLTIANTFAGNCTGVAVVGSTTTNAGTGVEIVKCKVSVPVVTGTSSNGYVISFTSTAGGMGTGVMRADSVRIDSNTIDGGGYSIVFSGGSAAAYNRNVVIRNNTITNSNYMGVYAVNNYNPLMVMNNTMTMGQNYGYYGIYFYNNRSSDATVSHMITGNKVYGFGGYGIYAYNPLAVSSAAKVIINNNLAVGNTTSSSYPGYYGIALQQLSSADNADVYHNTAVMNNPYLITAGYAAFYNVTGTLVNYKNNLMVVQSGAYVPFYSNTNLSGNTLNYNVYWNTAGTNLVYRNATYFTAANFKTATAGGDSSWNTDPQFLGVNNYRLNAGCLRGVDLTANVPADIEQATRSTSPSVGAYEFAGILNDIIVEAVTSQAGTISSGLQDVTFRVRNNGTNTITSFNANHRLNNGTIVTMPWTGSLATCDTVIVTMSGSYQVNVPSGILNRLQVFTTGLNGTGDNNTNNDTAVKSFGTPLAGNYVIGAAPSDFTTISDATSNLNSRGISGAVTFQIKNGVYLNETFPILLAPVTGLSATNTVTIKPAASANVLISGNASSAIFKIANNAAYYTIDGSNNGTTSRNLYIHNTNTAASSCGVWFEGTVAAQGVKNTTLKNVIVKGGSIGASIGVLVGGATVNATGSNGLGYDQLLIQNNIIYNCYYALSITGAGAGTNQIRNVTVESNQIGTDSIGNQYYGMYLNYADRLLVRNNSILNTNTVAGLNNAGIQLANYVTNSTIRNNRINKVYSTSSGGWGAYGINVAGTTCDNDTFVNNTIADVLTSNYNLTSNIYNAFGLRIAGGSNLKIYNNSVSLFGSPSTGVNPTASAALLFTTTGLSGLDMRNNIFSNTMTSLTGSEHYAYWRTGSLSAYNINYNNYYAGSAQGILLNNNGTDVNSMAALKAATVTDSNSISQRPGFTTNTNLMPNTADTASWFINGGGVQIAANIADINGNARSTSLISGAPDMGAFEFTPAALAPMAVAIPDAPVAGTTQVFLYGSDTIAKIMWAPFATVPTSIVGRMYTGVYPAGISGTSHHSLNSYWDFDVPAGNYSYDITLFYKPNMLGSIPSETSMLGAKKSGTFPWNVYGSASTVNDVANTLTITGLGDFSIFTGTTIANPVPVKLNEFRAVAMGNDALVYWNTASEKNVSHFNVEASADGHNFKVVGKVEAKGNSSVSSRYSFTHADAQRAMGASVIYYRLTSVDRDASASKSPVVLVDFGRANSRLDAVNVFPNPFAANLTVSIPSLTDGTVTIEVMDIQGKTVQVMNSNISQGANEVELNILDALDKGIYFVKLTLNNESKVVKVIKH